MIKFKRSSSPDARFLQPGADLTPPIPICKRIGRARMKNAHHPYGMPTARLHSSSPLFGEPTDSDNPLRPQNVEHLQQMVVAEFIKRCTFIRGELIRCSIPSRLFEKGQRTVIDDKVLLEESTSLAELLCKKAPETLSADL